MYKFSKELKKGDSGQEVLDVQNRLIEIKQDTSFLEDGSVGKIETSSTFDDITEQCIAGLKARAFDLISMSYIKEKFEYFYHKDIPEEWLEINGDVNPLFGLFLEHYEDIQQYLGTNITPAPVFVVPPISEDEQQTDQDKLKVALHDILVAQIGIREATGNNDGKEIEHIIDIGSGGEIKHGGPPYCQYGQNFGLIEAVNKLILAYKWWYNGYTPDNVNKGKQLKLVTGGNSNGGHVSIEDIQPSMWFYLYSSTRRSAHHVGYVEAINDDGTITTIEFNTNNNGSAEGDGVYRKIRSLSQMWAVLDIISLY